MQVGIEAIEFAVPQQYVDMQDLAIARGVEPAKFINGLGQTEMAVATPCEDSVSLAIQAAAQLVRTFDIDASKIGMVIVGTETPVDQSKPIAVYVHEHLGLSPNCRTFETKHACYGAMAGVTLAKNWILSGQANGRKALVIATDIARYGARTPGEPTQGAGAVALLISDKPDLIEFETESEGYFSQQVMDFWRPNYSKEAFADGHFSMQCYLNALGGAYDMVRAGKKLSASLAACFYHSPFVKMAQKAHVKFLELETGKAFEKDSTELSAALADYKKRVAPSLEINARIGNIYTGALFLSLIGFLADAAPEASGSRISLFSYGSGSVAEMMLAKLTDTPARQKLTGFRERLDRRTRLTIEQYEAILEKTGSADLNETSFDPKIWGLSGSVYYLGTQEHKRQYKLVT